MLDKACEFSSMGLIQCNVLTVWRTMRDNDATVSPKSDVTLYVLVTVMQVSPLIVLWML